jgi:hypothetical protein
MSDALDGATAFPTFPLPDTLFAKFVVAAQKDALVDSQAPLQFIKSQAQQTNSDLGKFFANAGEQAGVVAAAGATSIVAAILMAPAALFMIGTWLDPNRSISIMLVNNLPTGLNIAASDAHLDTGHAVTLPAVVDANGAVTSANHVLGRGDVSGLDGAGVGVFYFEKSTTLGIGFYGTEGAIHLTAEDSTLLPNGVYIGWRVPEKGENTCAISINSYRDAKDFYERWINDNNSRQTDQSTAAGAVAHCAISSLQDCNIAMVALLDAAAS